MRYIFILFGFVFLSCQDIFYYKNREQEKLKQHIESKEDIELPIKLIPNDKFVFLEIIETQTAEVFPKNKNIISIPIKYIDFPMYFYNDTLKKIKTLDKSFKPDFDEFKIVLGHGIWLGKNRGSGGATRLSEIKYFPFYNGETAVYEIDSLGSVYLRHENKYYKINFNKTIIDSSFFDLELNGNEGCRLKVKREFKISNHGLLNKTAIVYDTIRK